MFTGNATGISLLGGSQNNTIGPNVTVSYSGTSGVPGSGISFLGALTRYNQITNVKVTDTTGPGVQVAAFASYNELLSCTVTNSVGSAVAITNGPGTHISGCTLQGKSGCPSAMINCVSWSPNLLIESNHITGAGASAGILLQGASAASIAGNQIDGSFTAYGAGVSLFQGCDQTVVQGNVIGTQSGSGPDFGISVRDAASSVLLQNKIYVGNNNGQAGDCGIVLGEDAHYVVAGPDNEIIGAVASAGSSAVALSGSQLGPDGAKIVQNKIEGNGLISSGVAGVNVGDDLVVDGNDISGCTDFGIHLGPTGSSRAVNNLVHDNPGATGIQLPWDTGGKQPQLLFNTVVCCDVPIVGDGRIWYNIFWSNDNLASFNKAKADIHCNDVQGRASLGLSSDNAEVDPKFVNPHCGGGGDYHLSSGSPMIDFSCNPGKSPPSLPNHDMDRDARPKRGAYDVGKDERP